MLGESAPEVYYISNPDGNDNLQFEDEDTLTLNACKETLKKIIKGSTANVYKDSLLARFERNLYQGHHYLQIDLSDLNFTAKSLRPEFHGSISQDDVVSFRKTLYGQPHRVLEVCDEALRDIYVELKSSYCDVVDETKKIVAPPMQAQFVWSPSEDPEKSQKATEMKKIRDIMEARLVQKLIIVQGIVVSVRKSDFRKARKIVYTCRRCSNRGTKFIPYGYHGVHIPKKCETELNRTGDAADTQQKCGQDPYIIIPEECIYVDEQTVKLQELPEEVPIGEMPRGITLQLNRNLVDSMMPGNRVVVVGVVECMDKPGRTGGRGSNKNVKFSYINVIGSTIIQGQKQGVSFSEDEEERLKEYSKDPLIREKIFNSIAPAILPSDKDTVKDVKEAVACLLFGGRTKKLPDGQRMRGDINVLLLGDPSVAKSQFLKFVAKTSPIAVYTSGKGSSAAGLTAAITKDMRSGSFQLEGGAMVLADGGVVCIDEFDKMRNDDRVAIHEAMEQQTISIAKAGITVVLNTRCSVLAAANPIFGSYDDLSSTADQVDFATTILSRFDLIFLIRDVRDEKRDFDLGMHIIGLHQGKKVNAVEAEISVQELKKYVTYARQRCHPVLSEDAANMLQDLYIEVRQKVLKEKREGSGATIPITVRQLEAIVRIAESLAKMELLDVAGVKHVEEAKRLFLAATMAASNTNRGLDPKTDDERKEVERAEELILNRVTHGSRIQRTVLVNYLVGDLRLSDRIAKMAIHYLVVKEVLQEQANFSYKRIM